MGHEAPTMRPSNLAFTVELSNLDLRIPVAEPPDGQQIAAPAPDVLPEGYLPASFITVPALSNPALPALLTGLLVSGWLRLRGRKGRAR
jgi:hypothetical protein